MTISKSTIISITSIALVVAALGSAGYFYYRYQTSQQLLTHPDLAAKEELSTISAKVGKLMQLPNNETPTLATVSDKTKLSEQSFFSQAENGDKVLIYTQNRKAILYRPSINKIIEVSQVNIALSPTPSPTTTTISQTARVVIYNGTWTAGLASLAQTQLHDTLDTNSIQVIDKQNATNRDYTDTLVIDLKGSFATLASQIATTLGGTTGTLPITEATPDADILIIIGSKYKK